MNQKFWKKYEKAMEKFGSQRQAANYLKVPRSTLQGWLRDKAKAEVETPVLPTFNVMRKDEPIHVATDGKVKRFILTAAQDQSAIHGTFLRNLEIYAHFMNAEILIGGFTYNKSLFEDHAANASWYHPDIERYLTSRKVIFGENLVFCGNMNTLPTAANPLYGFETYTRHRSGIFPHAKVRLDSIPTMKGSPAKINMTTGAITRTNYVPKRAGITAAFHHVIGAVIVEIHPEREDIWFARHIQAEDNGAFQDLDTYITYDGKIILNMDCEAITWGDIHFPRYDSQVIDSAFKRGGMLDTLNPSYQMIHDLCDFDLRSHHSMKDPHKVFSNYFWSDGMSIAESFENMAKFLQEEVVRDYCKTIVVESNHDKHFLKWLKEADWKNDPANAELYLEANLHIIREIKKANANPNMLEWGLRRSYNKYNEILDSSIKFLNEDESFVICAKEGDTGIEVGIHGHLGANGARPNPKQFTKMGPRANLGHQHSASIIDGIYTAGTSSMMDMGYNKGLSSWSHSHILTYKNRKRCIVTMREGQWRI